MYCMAKIGGLEHGLIINGTFLYTWVEDLQHSVVQCMAPNDVHEVERCEMRF